MTVKVRSLLLATALALAATTAASGETGSLEDIELNTFAGSYLAGRAADADHDLAGAARFYAAALEADSGNPLLLESAVMLYLATGDFDEAMRYAGQLVSQIPGSAFARIALGIEAMKTGEPELAREHFSRVGPTALAKLTGGLLEAWVAFDEGDIDGAVATVDELSGPSWYAIFKAYHTAVLLDAAGRSEEAVDHARAAAEADASAIGLLDGYARILARAGKRQEAIDTVTAFAGEEPLHPMARDLLATLRGGLTPEPVAVDAASGAAAVLYGLGSAIGGDDGPELPAAYLQLARYLDPGSHVSAMAIGDVLQDAERCTEAIEFYESVPLEHPLRRNANIQIGNCLYNLERSEESAAVLQSVVDANPADFEAAMQLGTVYRLDQRYEEAIDAYTRGLSQLADDTNGIWRIYYYRGIAYERSKLWPFAEADFKKALELNQYSADTLNNVGVVFASIGRTDKARDYFNRALSFMPTHSDARENMEQIHQ